MNYERIYNQIVDRAKTRQLEGYKERHHIIPRCMGGTDDTDNLVDLTAREHYIVHLLLSNIYPDNRKLIFACWMLMNAANKYQERNYKVSSRMYEHLKLLKSKIGHSDQTKQKLRVANLGKKRTPESIKKGTATRKKRYPANPKPYIRKTDDPNYKRPEISEEHKLKISRSNKGKKRSVEFKKLMSDIHSDKTISDIHKERLRIAHTGKVLTTEHKLKLSIAKLGKPKPKLTCPICNKIGGEPQMKRWHFENCRYKNLE